MQLSRVNKFNVKKDREDLEKGCAEIFDTPFCVIMNPKYFKLPVC